MVSGDSGDSGDVSRDSCCDSRYSDSTCPSSQTSRLFTLFLSHRYLGIPNPHTLFSRESISVPSSLLSLIVYRYRDSRESASSFLMVQLGICTFEWEDPETRKKLIAKPFNFYAFPDPTEKAFLDKRFLCQTSSLRSVAVRVILLVDLHYRTSAFHWSAQGSTSETEWWYQWMAGGGWRCLWWMVCGCGA